MDQQYKELFGKTVLVVGAGHIGHRHIWKTLHDAKLKVILVHPDDKVYVKDYVNCLKIYNYMEGTTNDDEFHADKILQILGDKGTELSACFTFDDYAAHLVAILCKKLGFVGTTPMAALAAKSKKQTYDIIKCKLKDSKEKRGICPSLSFRVNSEEDILNVKGISYPAILKPEQGNFSNGVVEVFSASDCTAQYKMLQKSFGIDWCTGKGGNGMVLMEIFKGNVYQVDLIIFKGNLLKSIVCVMGPKFRDLGPPLAPVFSDTTTCYSSCLPTNTEKELSGAAFHCCELLGLYHGVFNVEMTITDSGFRLIEINCRPGSYRRCSTLKVTHGIDLWIIQALIACGIEPILPDVQKRFAVGCYLYSFIHKESLSKQDVNDKIDSFCKSNDILYMKQREHLQEEEEAFPKPFAHIVAIDENSTNAAKSKLIKIFHELELSNSVFDVEKMTEMFSSK